MTPDAQPTWLSAAHRLLLEHAPLGFAVLDQDLRDVEASRSLAEERAGRANLLQQLTVALAAAVDLDQVARAVTVTVTGALRADAGVIAGIGADGTCRLLATDGLPDLTPAMVASFQINGHPLAGDLFRSLRPMLIPSRADWDRRFPTVPPLGRACAAWAVLPLVTDGTPTGIAAFGWRSSKRFTPADVELLLAVAGQTGTALERVRLFDAERTALAAAEQAKRRFAILAEASTRLAAMPTEHEQLAALADLIIDGFADTCAVLMPDEEGQLRRRIVRTVDPGFARHLQTFIDSPVPTTNVNDARLIAWSTGRVAMETVPDVAPYLGAWTAEASGELAKIAGVSVSIAAPLIARGQILGVVSLWRNRQQAPGSAEDEQLLADLGRRAGIAIDNARLLAARTHVATRLQETLLPYQLPAIPGVELAATYLVAEGAAEVGGDLYDAFQVDDGSWALVIGDVAGRGVDAAGLTGLARATLRALAPDLPVPAALARLDTLLAERAKDDSMLTLAYLLLRPDRHGATVRVWLAGHPPPLRLAPDGTLTELGHPRPPLGVGNEITPPERWYRIDPGDLLVLYTDGLTEARGVDGPFGSARLPGLLRELAGCSAATVAARIRREVLAYRRGRNDDVGVLIARLADR